MSLKKILLIISIIIAWSSVEAIAHPYRAPARTNVTHCGVYVYHRPVPCYTPQRRSCYQQSWQNRNNYGNFGPRSGYNPYRYSYQYNFYWQNQRGCRTW